MTGSELARILRSKSSHYPITDAYERDHSTGGRPVWYSSQREHMTGWIAEIDGPGGYNRVSRGLGARHAYTHLQCAAGLLWIAEALGEEPEVVQQAADAAGGIGRGGTQCAAIRRVIPWDRIAMLAGAAKAPLWSRAKALLAFRP